jgi:hypothetical protein
MRVLSLSTRIGTPAFAKIAQGFLRERVQPAGRDIDLELLIPSFGVEFVKPVPKGGKLLAGKLGYGEFDFGNHVHGWLLVQRNLGRMAGRPIRRGGGIAIAFYAG